MFTRMMKPLDEVKRSGIKSKVELLQRAVK
jgi:hypothetical protein